MDVLIIGAGVSGLACARELAANGVTPLVVERGRSVGGRCSSWRSDQGHVIDYGVTYYHGESESFLAALRQTPATVREGWPARIEGHGQPCQPHSLSPRSVRLAFAEGASAFPKHLARGLDVRTGFRVDRIEQATDSLVVRAGDRPPVHASTVVLAMPTDQMLPFLRPFAEDREVLAAVRLIDTLRTIPCLTLLAAYDDIPAGSSRAATPWDMLLPHSSQILQLVSRESSKRPSAQSADGEAFVMQARPGWSARNLDRDPGEWSAAMLAETAMLMGRRYGSPVWTRYHRWEFARTDRGGELAGPMLFRLGSARLGLCGETFHPGAGVEAAYLSGVAMARRLTEETDTGGDGH